MKKLIIIILGCLLFFCKDNKTEFIESKSIGGLILLKNPPTQDSLVKRQLIAFLLKNLKIPQDSSSGRKKIFRLFLLYNSKKHQYK